MSGDLFWGLSGTAWTAIGVVTATVIGGIGIWQNRTTKNRPRRNWPTHLVGYSEPPRPVQGRKTMVKDLRFALSSQGKAAVVYGSGGIGKTTLARYYIQEYRGYYEGIVWLNAETDLAAQFAGLAPLFEVTPAGEDAQTAKLVLSELTSCKKPWLLVYDNATKESDIRPWLAANKAVHVLVTSRSLNWSPEFADLAPKVLPCKTAEDAGPQVLMTEAKRFDDPNGAVALAQALDGLPLALVVAGALVRSGCEFSELAGDVSQITQTADESDYAASLMAAVKLSYDRLSADARAVLDLFAWFAPDGLEARLLTDVLGSERSSELLAPITEELNVLCKDPARVHRALRELVGRSLLAQEGDQFALHRLTAEAVRRLQVDRAEGVMGAAAAVLAAGYPTDPGVSKAWPRCRRLTLHVLAYCNVSSEVSSSRLATVDWLFLQTAQFLDLMGNSGRAVDLAKISKNICCRRLPQDHFEVAVRHSMLGRYYSNAGHTAEAIATTTKAVQLFRNPKFSRLEYATALSNHGRAVMAEGSQTSLAESVRIQKEVLEIRRDKLGTIHDDVAVTLINLSDALCLQGDYSGALVEAVEALEIRKTLINRGSGQPDSAQIGNAYAVVGRLLCLLGRYSSAEPDLREAVRILYLHYDVDHWRCEGTVPFLVLARLKLGDASGARELADRYGLDWDERLRRAAQYPDPMD